MHPIERLRYVARSAGTDPTVLAVEAAYALSDVARVEPAGLVAACRRLVQRHPTSGPIWWLCARVLTATDLHEAALLAAEELESDLTDRHVAEAFDEEATVALVGWPDLVAPALYRRGDVEALVIDAGRFDAAQQLRRRGHDVDFFGADQAGVLVERLNDAGSGAQLVPGTGLASAVLNSSVVVVEAQAAGPSGLLATPGSHAAAAVAVAAGIRVLGVCGVGRVLPAALWDALLARIDEEGVEPWYRSAEVVPATLLGEVVTPLGREETPIALGRATCPAAPELLRAAF